MYPYNDPFDIPPRIWRLSLALGAVIVAACIVGCWAYGPMFLALPLGVVAFVAMSALMGTLVALTVQLIRTWR